MGSRYYMSMADGKVNRRSLALLAVAVSILVAACGGGDAGLSSASAPEADPTPGLTRADVEDAISSAVRAMPEPGLTRDDVERIVAAAIESIPEPETGLRAAEVRRGIGRGNRVDSGAGDRPHRG